MRPAAELCVRFSSAWQDPGAVPSGQQSSSVLVGREENDMSTRDKPDSKQPQGPEGSKGYTSILTTPYLVPNYLVGDEHALHPQ